MSTPVSSYTTQFLCQIIGLLFLALPVSASHAITIDELMTHIDELWRGDTSQTTMRMTVKTRRYERTMSMEAWSSGKEHSLIIIREPMKDRGISTLKVKENIWNYLPKINRISKVPASMMSGSWMGSHFTNDDLVKESSFVDDYDSHISFEGNREGVAVYEITSIPRPDAAVVWGKVVMVIRQDNYAPITADYFDEEGVKVRVMQFDRIEYIDGRAIPMRLILTPEDKPGESTVVSYEKLRFGVELDENFFSLKSLKRQH